MFLKKQLGKRIQLLRKRKKLTQEQFAELVGIDPKSISKIENGVNYPTAETLTSIANALDAEIYELFLFKEHIPLEEMKQEIISSLDSNKNILKFYDILKVATVEQI